MIKYLIDYLSNPNASLREKILIFIIWILNAVSGLSHLLLALSINIYAFIAGWLYLIFGVSVLKRSSKLKAIFYFVMIPLTAVSLYSVVHMYSTFGSNPPYGIDFWGWIIFGFIPILTLFVDVFYFHIIKRAGSSL